MKLVNFITENGCRISLVIVVVMVFMILVMSCISKPGKIAQNEIPLTPQTAALPAARQFYIYEGQYEQFAYWGHNITINYASAQTIQIVKVTLDGVEKIFKKKPTESPNGIYWKDGDLSFTLKPVLWELRDGQEVPVYEVSWNTSEIYFEVRIMLSSEETGEPLR